GSSPSARIASDVDPTSVEEPVSYSVVVSPNPSNGEFDLRINGDSITQCYVTVSDMVGRNITQQVINSSDSIINAHMSLIGVPAGIYILSVRDNNSTQTVRRVIIK